MSLEHIVAVHSHKKEKVKHYSSKFTYSLALVCFIFFGTILSYHATVADMNHITGMAVYLGNSEVAEDSRDVGSNILGFVTAVRESPQVTEIKLFFYTIWILVVLVGSAVWYEVKEKY
ncbi:MAG: hypothetical protein AABX98_05430 [Nanoarchaeota archaeon]